MLALLVAIFAATVTTLGIIGPIKKLKTGFEALRAGDLTVTVEVAGQHELGALAEDFTEVVGDLGRLINDVRVAAGAVEGSAHALQSNSSALGERANEMKVIVGDTGLSVEQAVGRVGETVSSTQVISDHVGGVAQMLDDMSGQVSGVATEAEVASSTVTGISAAVEEMAISLEEVARRCVDAAGVSAAGSEEARGARAQMLTLNETVAKVGKVIGVIEAIASQTNLLALNANIEAVGAGKYGAGFAVVAHEVKQLALKTGEATSEVASSLREIQEAADRTAASIGAADERIGEVTELTAQIAAAVEEQTATLREVSEGVQGGAAAMIEIRDAVQGMSDGVDKIAGRVLAISEEASAVASQADEVNEAMSVVASGNVDVSAGVESTVDVAGKVAEAAAQMSVSAEQMTGSVARFTTHAS